MGRHTPGLPAHAFKTYGILAPIRTHFRPGTCEEAGCPAHAHGWVTRVDESGDLGQAQAHYIRSESGRRYREERAPDGLTIFTFEAGQRCFKRHLISLEREPIFMRRLGDHRGDPTGARPYIHTTAQSWVDDFATHQQHLTGRG